MTSFDRRNDVSDRGPASARAAPGLCGREHLGVRRACEGRGRGIVNRGNIVAAPAQL